LASTQEMQWVLRAQCRDREALEALLRTVQPSLRRYLCGLVGSTDADDVHQDVLMIVVRRLGTLEDPALFRPWLFRIASRRVFRHLRIRREWRERHENDSQLDRLPSPDTLPTADILPLLSTDIVSPSSRAVMFLHFQEGLTLTDIAAILEIPVGTAKSRLAYGLRLIRQHLAASGDSNDRPQR